MGTNALGVRMGSVVTVSVATVVNDPGVGRRLRLGWGGEGERTEQTLTVTGNMVVAAGWEPEYWYGVSAGPGGTVEGSASGWKGEGTWVSNRAEAVEGCEFIGWENVPEGMGTNNPMEFVMTEPRTNVVARFGLLPPPVGGSGFENGYPELKLPAIPAGFTMVVERSESLLPASWERLGALPAGATNWLDATATGEWNQLYYRLSE